MSPLDRLVTWGRTIVRSTCFYVVTFVDYRFDKISEPFETMSEAAIYSRGFVSGAGRHGPGWVRAFVLPEEHADLVEWAKTCCVDIKPALAAMAAALEGR